MKSKPEILSTCFHLILVMILLFPGIWAINPAYQAAARGRSGPALANSITVMNVNDSGPGSLRQALADINTSGTISFDPALAGQTITLVSTLSSSKSMTIDGSGLNPPLSISGNSLVRIFTLGAIFGQTTLRSLILRNGNTLSSSGAAILSGGGLITLDHVSFIGNQAYYGGALYMALYNTKFAITNCVFQSNSANNQGGAIYAQYGDLDVRNSTFTNNSSSSVGSAIYSPQGGTFTILDNAFIDNTESGGGAVSLPFPGFTIIRGNLFSGNTATTGWAGALMAAASQVNYLFIENNTFIANQAAVGGGALGVGNYATIRNNTFSGNKSNDAGGNKGGSIYMSAWYNIILYNNIFANNTGGGECYASTGGVTTLTGGKNIVEDGSLPCSSLSGTIIADPSLGTLHSNGGPTQTMALLHGSPAIDAANDANCPATDQRGVSRPQGPHCDIGAFELAWFTISGNTGIGGTSLNYDLDGPQTAASDANGLYSFPVPEFWSGTVTPVNTGRTFEPVFRTYSNVIASLVDQDYAPYATISGNAGLADLLLLYTGGTTTTNEAGDYTIIVPVHWSGSVEPRKTCYSFTPGQRTYSDVTIAQPGQDFIAQAYSYCGMIYLPFIIR